MQIFPNNFDIFKSGVGWELTQTFKSFTIYGKILASLIKKIRALGIRSIRNTIS